MIDDRQNAVLINIGGTGGFYLQWDLGSWLANVQNSIAIAEYPDAVLVDTGGTVEFDRNWVPWEITRRFQIWGSDNNLPRVYRLRKELLWIAGHMGILVPEGGPLNTLETVASGLMTLDPEAQRSLSDSLAILNLSDSKRDMEN
ncbi:hypothetical protein N7540_012200 [Penicillium herquei]|nr:hypothetical protein N7540_012200 [Penicillium herquei]